MDLEQLAEECEIEFTRTGGPGGQHRNRSSTAVRLTHRPTGITVVAGDSRSQHQNRLAALQRLAEKLEARERERQARERREKRKKKPFRADREKRLREKKERSQQKKLRRRVRPSDADRV
jgi:protein subunit release factor A